MRVYRVERVGGRHSTITASLCLLVLLFVVGMIVLTGLLLTKDDSNLGRSVGKNDSSQKVVANKDPEIRIIKVIGITKVLSPGNMIFTDKGIKVYMGLYHLPLTPGYYKVKFEKEVIVEIIGRVK